MLKQQEMTDSQKPVRLSLWKRLILIVGMLLSGGSLAVLVPGQAAYANASWPHTVFICKAGDAGSGGIADNGSAGGNGGLGGDCIIGGAKGGVGGVHGSPGGDAFS